DPARAPAFLSNPHDQSQWYPGKIPYEWSIHLHCGSFQTDRDWIGLKKLLQRWIRPNGLLWGMAKTNYGRGGGWTESLGIIRPITNLLLMTRGGIVDVFPYWPKNQDASFAGLRAYGGIMVSASLQSNRVRRIGLDLPPDSQCRLALPSARFDCSQNGMAFIPKVANGVASFCSARDNSSSITLEFVG
ncbi:MAG TPA: hypothetical protein VG722_04715, partial [Tepidisphaeraceae bacterium]|nr:hypothetical protein [Tepidisphaeraceae bacterium]